MNEKIWCRRIDPAIRRARLVNILRAMTLACAASLPVLILLLSVSVNPGPLSVRDAKSAIQAIRWPLLLSVIAYCGGMGLAVAWTQRRIRPPDRTHVGPPSMVTVIKLLELRERQLGKTMGREYASLGRVDRISRP